MLTIAKSHALLIVLAIAIGARLGVLLAFPDIFAYTEPGVAIQGSAAYDAYALNLLDTGVYGRQPGIADAVLPPLYSYLVAAVYRIFGAQYLAIASLHIVFDALSIVLLAAICRRLMPGRGVWVGRVAGLFFALYPYLIFQNLTLNDTALWILLLHLFVWLLICLRERERLDKATLALALAAGAVLGISALARSTLAPFALLAALWFGLRLSWRQTALRLLPVAVVSVLALLPWLARGYAIYGDFVPIALNSGENIFQGNNAQTVPIFRAGYDAQWAAPPLDIPPKEQPLARNAALAAAGWGYLRAHPARIPELLLVKLQVYWSAQITPRKNLRLGEKLQVDADGAVRIITGAGSHAGVSAANAVYQDSPLSQLMRAAHVLYFGGLWLLALAGAWRSRRCWRALSLLYFLQISQTLVYLLFHPSTRYRSPTDPLLFVFSAVAVLALVEWWRKSRNMRLHV